MAKKKANPPKAPKPMYAPLKNSAKKGIFAAAAKKA